MEKNCCAAKGGDAAGDTLAQYRPLIVIASTACAAGLALAWGRALPAMPMLMGAFLTLLALMKLFDRRGFADAFVQYDPLAARARGYALAYPAIELTLGLFYLSGFAPLFTNIATLAVLAVTTAGVVGAVKKGKKLQCGCAGTQFVLPVGRVTIFENGLMMFMALVSLGQIPL